MALRERLGEEAGRSSHPSISKVRDSPLTAHATVAVYQRMWPSVFMKPKRASGPLRGAILWPRNWGSELSALSLGSLCNSFCFFMNRKLNSLFKSTHTHLDTPMKENGKISLLGYVFSENNNNDDSYYLLGSFSWWGKWKYLEVLAHLTNLNH